ncbi:MAG TPA: hypothetical protein VGR93_03070 [Candidatus Acidoferrales bacterium]|nr:hypothetical protein [Candidatus Acidoferrales bacterium]
MKRILAAIFVACIVVAVAFAYIHHRHVEAQRQAFDASSPIFANTPAAVNEALPRPSTPDLTQQLPGGAHAVVFADMVTLRASSFANELASLAPTPEQDPSYSEFVRATGFDYSRDLDRVAVALWPQASPTSVLALAQGRFDEAKIERYALRSGRRLKINGAYVYEVRAQNSPRLVRFAFLNPHEIALADGPAISRVLGPERIRLDPPMAARAAAVSRAPIYLVARTQDLSKDLGIDASKSAQLARLLSSVHAITAAGQPAGKNLNVSASAECDSTVDAFELSTTLQGLLWMGRAALADPKTQQQIGPQWPALEAVLKAADISHDSNFVRLRLQLTPQMLHVATASSANGTSQR